ncbi:hypothetical protein EDD37DRAFT_658345 [Exophiala viscosa]|uniref:uncharacterized protein n=1 Tax=Exophiala viscosa TaxID=2486360 RepID=UPI00218D8FD8|nr:hypothetical protein EDD37DRAFT_658345 [Exophiala viscosa]
MHRQGSQSPPAVQSKDIDLQLPKVKEKSLYPCSKCGKPFRDLKSHMVTHQADRPHKCPLSSCEFHLRGFARKYDQIRHTICHYRGFMVCEYCPGAHSPNEISFHRVDALKQHLVHVHHVERTTKKNKKVPASTVCPNDHQVIVHHGESMIISSTSSASSIPRCSLCGYIFQQPQHWYNHLDDCILSTILQDVPSNHINTLHLLSVADDPLVEETLHLHKIKSDHGLHPLRPTIRDEAGPRTQGKEQGEGNIEQNHAVHREVEEEEDGEGEGEEKTVRGARIPGEGRRRRSRRKDGAYPQYWGVSPEYLNLKRRALYVHDGPHRIWKDDLLLYTSLEVRLPLSGHTAHNYVTDLDVQTIHTAESIYHAHRSRTTTPPWNFMTP